MIEVKRNILNKLLILRFIKISSGIKGPILLQYLVFSAEELGRKMENVTFNYHFINGQYGPYSSELFTDINFLTIEDLINYSEGDGELTLTNKGDMTLTKARILFKDSLLDSQFKKVLNRYKGKELEEIIAILNEKYRLYKYDKGETIFHIKSKEEMSTYL